MHCLLFYLIVSLHFPVLAHSWLIGTDRRQRGTKPLRRRLSTSVIHKNSGNPWSTRRGTGIRRRREAESSSFSGLVGLDSDPNDQIIDDFIGADVRLRSYGRKREASPKIDLYEILKQKIILQKIIQENNMQESPIETNFEGKQQIVNSNKPSKSVQQKRFSRENTAFQALFPNAVFDFIQLSKYNQSVPLDNNASTSNASKEIDSRNEAPDLAIQPNESVLYALTTSTTHPDDLLTPAADTQKHSPPTSSTLQQSASLKGLQPSSLNIQRNDTAKKRSEVISETSVRNNDFTNPRQKGKAKKIHWMKKRVSGFYHLPMENVQLHVAKEALRTDPFAINLDGDYDRPSSMFEGDAGFFDEIIRNTRISPEELRMDNRVPEDIGLARRKRAAKEQVELYDDQENGRENKKPSNHTESLNALNHARLPSTFLGTSNDSTAFNNTSRDFRTPRDTASDVTILSSNGSLSTSDSKAAKDKDSKLKKTKDKVLNSLEYNVTLMDQRGPNKTDHLHQVQDNTSTDHPVSNVLGDKGDPNNTLKLGSDSLSSADKQTDPNIPITVEKIPNDTDLNRFIGDLQAPNMRSQDSRVRTPNDSRLVNKTYHNNAVTNTTYHDNIDTNTTFDGHGLTNSTPIDPILQTSTLNDSAIPEESSNDNGMPDEKIHKQVDSNGTFSDDKVANNTFGLLRFLKESLHVKKPSSTHRFRYVPNNIFHHLQLSKGNFRDQDLTQQIPKKHKMSKGRVKFHRKLTGSFKINRRGKKHHIGQNSENPVPLANNGGKYRQKSDRRIHIRDEVVSINNKGTTDEERYHKIAEVISRITRDSDDDDDDDDSVENDDDSEGKSILNNDEIEYDDDKDKDDEHEDDDAHNDDDDDDDDEDDDEEPPQPHVVMIRPTHEEMSEIERATSNLMERAFFNAVDDVVKNDEPPEISLTSEDPENDEAYYESVFQDYSADFKDSDPSEPLVSNDDLEEVLAVSSLRRLSGLPQLPHPDDPMKKSVVVVVPPAGVVDPLRIGSGIPGYSDDRMLTGLENTGFVLPASAISRMLIEEHENNVLEDLDLS